MTMKHGSVHWTETKNSYERVVVSKITYQNIKNTVHHKKHSNYTASVCKNYRTRVRALYLNYLNKIKLH